MMIIFEAAGEACAEAQSRDLLLEQRRRRRRRSRAVGQKQQA